MGGRGNCVSGGAQFLTGATLNVLNSISKTLAEALPAIESQDWSVSYARLLVLTGQEALARLTIRMHIPLPT
jgi:hypothetical protein